MNDLFELVFEYRSLLARSRADLRGLNLPARARLDALHRLLGREPTDAEGTRPGDAGRRRHARCDVRLTAVFQAGLDAVRVEVVNLGAGGVCIRGAGECLADRGVLHLTAPDTGRSYECVAETAWREGDLVGLRFVGEPRLLHLAS